MDGDSLSPGLPSEEDPGSQNVRVNSTGDSAHQLDATGTPMTAKEEVMVFLRNMPDDVTFDEIMYEFFMLEKLKISEESVRNGDVRTHEEVTERFKDWLRPDVSTSPRVRVIEMLCGLPGELTYEDIHYHVSVLEKIERGIESADWEPTVSQEEMEADFGTRYIK